MPRGGRRAGSGRKPIWQDAQCTWIVYAVQLAIRSGEKERQHRWILRKYPKYNYVFKNHAELQALSVTDRRRILKNPEGTPLEDVDAMLYGTPEGPPEVPRLISIPPLSSHELSKIYELVALQASSVLGKRFTSKRVRLIMRRWAAAERSLE